MASGRVLWFDPNTGEGRVVASGHEYTTRADDMEPKARAAGVAVRFDTRRDGDGVARAVRVRLRPGTRTSRRQRRFGGMAGARRPERKGRPPLTRGQPDREPRFSHEPPEIAERWVRAANSGSLASALPLYAPDAVLHVAGASHHGRSRVGRALQDAGLLRHGWDARVHGDGDTLVLRRVAALADRALRTRLLIRHGEITEQWVESASRASGP